MRFFRNFAVRAALFALVTASVAAAQSSGVPAHLFFRVTLGPQFQQPVSGRLLLFVSPGHGDKRVDMDMMSPAKTYIAAREVPWLAPGQSIEIDADNVAFPAPLSTATQGDYEAQVVLDVAHTYAYGGRAPGDLESEVALLPGWDPRHQQPPELTLSKSEPGPPDPLINSPEVTSALSLVDFRSPALGRFWGREVHMKAWVLLPPGYGSHPGQRYPTVYFTHGFGGSLAGIRARFAPILYERMKTGKMPPMIWVLLDESSPTGTHESADGVNNGPWGTALTTELIPYLESHYRMDARVSGRFLQGHSSGGWATLWLQTTYPKIFGGTWSTSPDPSDFHSFTTVDLYAANANMYRFPDGSAHPVIRVHGTIMATIEQLARMEAVLGDYGGQLASFEWVFSPRGADGRPVPMFNRATGAVDPIVIAYWGEHYDIAHRIETHWASLAPDLRGKIHLFVGTDDTFYLDGPAHLLQSLLDRLGAKAQFTFIPGRTHFDLYREGDDKDALFDQIAAEMFAVARPRGKTSAKPK
jgi:S-formylglutathione hydrolase FrmB